MKNLFYLLLLLGGTAFGQNFSYLKVTSNPTTLDDNTKVDVLVREKSGANAGMVRKITWDYLTSLFSSTSTTPEKFGAVGDGSTDDWEAIQNAVYSDFNAVVLTKNYIVSRPIILPSGKNIILNGTIKLQDGFEDLLVSDMIAGESTIQVSGASAKYFPGQQVCISDDTKSVQGGGTGQTRRVGWAFTIQSVAGNTITFTNTSNQGFLVSASAKVGHCQSVFLSDGGSDITICGTGSVDQNKQHQYDIEPVTSTGTYTEDVRYGCAVTFLNGARINISGITAKNSVLHNFQFKYITDFNVDKVVADAAHDKGLLMWYCSRFNITNSRFLNSDWEDGIICHNNCDNGFISNIYTENCSRTGVYISNTNNNIVISGVVAKDCGRAFQTQNSYNIRVLGFKAIGGGVERYLSTARPIYTLTNARNSEFDFGVYGNTTAGSGISIVGSCENVKITGNIMDLLTSSGNGIGVLIGAASGNSPKNIDLSGMSIINCKTGLKVDTGSLNVKFTNGLLSGNTTAITNTAGTELKLLNVTGTTQNDLYGVFTLREENASGTAAEILQEAYGGQPSISTSRAPGTIASPTAIPVSNGLYRMRARGYNGSAFSSYFQWLSLIATESWTTTANGYKIGFRTNKTGTTSAGTTVEFYHNGLSIGETFTADSPATINAKAQTGQTLPILKAVRETGATAFSVNANGTVGIGAISDVEDTINGKQNTLVSGTTIKTVNGNSLLGSGDIAISGGGGGSVTSVTGTAGVTVANGTTTPVIGLGAITPTSVVASGNVSGANLSGTNTGDISGTGIPVFSGTTISWIAGTAARYVREDGSTALFSSAVQNNAVGTNTGTGVSVTTTTAMAKAIWDLQIQIDSMSTTNATTVGLSSATLNSTYPNVRVGYRVICGNITLGGAIYTKYSENGSSDVWLMTSAPVQM